MIDGNMMISPSVTTQTDDPHLFREQIERVSFASRIHIDLMDGTFAPNKNLNPIQVWWPDGVTADIHLMYKHPNEHLETLISLKPHMIILHAESDGDVEGYLKHIKRFGIKAGVALLSDTDIQSAHGCIAVSDHVLLFSGELGSFGGEVDLEILDKIPSIRKINENTEIGWDGGVNRDNVVELVDRGVDVVTVGGAIQRSSSPKKSYLELVDLLSKK